MIPTIEDILNGLLDGEYTLDKAVNLVRSHIDDFGLRDHFAASALQGMLANQHPYQASDEHMFSRDAYKLADAMLKERSK
jgi:hypothetical protein